MSIARLLAYILLYLVSFAVAQAPVNANDPRLELAASENASIPADLHIAFNPSVGFLVQFPQSPQPAGGFVGVALGDELPRSETVGPPRSLIFNIAGVELDPDQRFVVAAVDPDAPTPQSPTSAQIRHFLGSDFAMGETPPQIFYILANQTAPLSDWRQPTPPAGSDPHRYVFLLYLQPPGFDNQTLVTSDTPISNFNISAFTEQTGLGDPIAGTFMLVGPDPST